MRTIATIIEITGGAVVICVLIALAVFVKRRTKDYGDKIN